MTDTLTTRAVPEWVGKHPDQAIPPRVKLRVWERCGGRCALSGRKIMPGEAWEIDHILALANGGEHRELNLQIVLKAEHKAKTRADVATKAKTERVRKKFIGAWPPPARKLQSRGFPGGRNRENTSQFNRKAQDK